MFTRRRSFLMGLLVFAAACSDTVAPPDGSRAVPSPSVASGPSFVRSPWAATTSPLFQFEGAATDVTVPGGFDLLCDSDPNSTCSSTPVAPPAVDQVSSAAGDATTLSWSHTVGTGANRVLVVPVSIRDGKKTVAAVSYRGVPLTLLGARNNSDNSVRVELWYLPEPASGSGTVTVTMAAKSKIAAGAVSFTGADPVQPLRGFASVAGTAEELSLWIADSSASTELILAVASLEGDAGSLTPGYGQTQRYVRSTGTSGGEALGVVSTAPGSGTLRMQWTHPKAARWVTAAIVVRPYVVRSLGLTTYQAAFWAVRGQSRSLQINYAAGGGASPFMRLTTANPTYAPGRGNLAVGDSVLITATVDPSYMVVDFQPSGVQFGTPATLKIWYGGAGGDLNADGLVDGTDGVIEQSLLSMWFRQESGEPWTLFPATKNVTEKSFTASIDHFSGYGVAW